MIHIDDIHKSYGELKALDGLSLHVREGEVFGLLGPNGAGKTTTVSILVGLFPPDRGSVSIGKGGASEKAGGSERGSPTDRSTRARIGLAPQALALYDDLTGEENLAFFGRLQGLTGGDLGSRVGRALDFVGLSDRGKDRAKGYSGGMRRRLNLAAALLHDPPVLLLDEPTAGVDPQSRNALFENVKALRDQGRTVVYTTHYMEEAQRLCDRVGIIDQGRLLALGTVDALIREHAGKDRLVIDRGAGDETLETDDPLETLVKLRDEGGLKRFRMERPDLEQVFLNLTGRKLRDA